MMRDAELVKKAQAVFLGVALGDALGATTEFMTPAEIKAQFKVHQKIRGGGWLGVKPGQVTDDTEMSLAIAQALLAAGEWNLAGIADNFLGWMRNQPIDIGATVRKGIRTYMRTGELKMPVNEWDAGNGALMRMAPVVLFTLGDDRLLRRCSLEQAHLTHNHPLSDAACVSFGQMVQAAMLGADRFQLHAMARQLVAGYPSFRFNNYKGLASGYVVDTLQTVLHYFFSTGSFEECLVKVVNQGGDADTTGAIAGMLSGAFYGLDELPRRWLRKLDRDVRAEIEDSSAKLIKLSPWVARDAHIQELSGDLWEYHSQGYVVAITTNGKVSKAGRNVMARGTARQAAEHFPELPELLGGMINRSGNHVYDLGRRLVSFPVEHTPWEVPDLQLIKQSCRELRELADRNGWQQVIVPRPGCGGGGLSWGDVRPLLEPHFDERFRVISTSAA
ncbi:MAG TPA: ADP-ribosyl-[dinitrogen reductase] hydrolase [Malonomonas sp.]